MEHNFCFVYKLPCFIFLFIINFVIIVFHCDSMARWRKKSNISNKATQDDKKNSQLALHFRVALHHGQMVSHLQQLQRLATPKCKVEDPQEVITTSLERNGQAKTGRASDGDELKKIKEEAVSQNIPFCLWRPVFYSTQAFSTFCEAHTLYGGQSSFSKLMDLMQIWNQNTLQANT